MKRRASRLTVRVFRDGDRLSTLFAPVGERAQDADTPLPVAFGEAIKALAYRTGVTVSTIGFDVVLSAPHCYAEECASYVCSSENMLLWMEKAIRDGAELLKGDTKNE